MTSKLCCRCGIEQDVGEFWKNKSNADGLQTYCKSCLRPMHKQWLEENRDHQHDLQREWYQRNREEHLERSREWSATNRDKKNQHRRTRRALEETAKGEASVEQTAARMVYHGNKCIYCGGPFEEKDHMFPLSRGGSNWAANLAPACTTCNHRKATRTIWEFLALKGSL